MLELMIVKLVIVFLFECFCIGQTIWVGMKWFKYKEKLCSTYGRKIKFEETKRNSHLSCCLNFKELYFDSTTTSQNKEEEEEDFCFQNRIYFICFIKKKTAYIIKTYS